MRMVIQRVLDASVAVDDEVVGRIGQGLLVLLGVQKEDAPEQTQWMVEKLLNLRIFSDEEEKMNLSVKEIGGEVLVVSQFTLYANAKRGRRPDFIEAARGESAEKIYTKFCQEVEEKLGAVAAGRFGAKMAVRLTNDGPVTLIIDDQ